MITYKRLTSTASKDFSEAWNLYETSFPENERRNIEGQEHIVSLNNYYCEMVFLDEQHVGILFWWDFETLRYLEHMAITVNRQNEGLGSKIMKSFLNFDITKLTLLEVEPPITQIQKKRVAFYRKLGFKMNAYKYIQPSLQKCTEQVALKLLSFPSELNVESYNAFVSTYHKQIYSHMEIT